MSPQQIAAYAAEAAKKNTRVGHGYGVAARGVGTCGELVAALTANPNNPGGAIV
jgi:hypothetical protein